MQCPTSISDDLAFLISKVQPRPTSFVMWPSSEGIPINEFTTEGYFTCAFPTFHPTVAVDFLGQRHNQVTIGNYFKHLITYEDGRFAKHPQFRCFALNTETRWCALRIYIQQHSGDYIVVSACAKFGLILHFE